MFLKHIKLNSPRQGKGDWWCRWWFLMEHFTNCITRYVSGSSPFSIVQFLKVIISRHIELHLTCLLILCNVTNEPYLISLVKVHSQTSRVSHQELSSWQVAILDWRDRTCQFRERGHAHISLPITDFGPSGWGTPLRFLPFYKENYNVGGFYIFCFSSYFLNCINFFQWLIICMYSYKPPQ